MTQLNCQEKYKISITPLKYNAKTVQYISHRIYCFTLACKEMCQAINIRYYDRSIVSLNYLVRSRLELKVR